MKKLIKNKIVEKRLLANILGSDSFSIVKCEQPSKFPIPASLDRNDKFAVRSIIYSFFDAFIVGGKEKRAFIA